MDPSAALLLVTIGALTIYVIGIGGSTAGAIRVRERFRQRATDPAVLPARPGGRVVLSAPTLSGGLRTLRRVGWVAFPVALGLAIFAEAKYDWVAPVAVGLMVALNAFYFTAMQNMGEELTLEPDAFYIGRAGKQVKVRWAHVTEFTGARVGTFSASKMSDAGDWQDPRARPNVIFYRLNRALVAPRRSVMQRLLGFTYYDGVIRNAFGIPTEQLLRTMRDWQTQALEAEDVPLRPGRLLKK
jgi:hypothetical protein